MLPETRGYLVGKNSSNRYVIPDKLMEKIIDSTGDTALLMWIPHKNTLKILSVDTEKVSKVTIWFEQITQTIFDGKLNPLLGDYKDLLIYKTGVLFPAEVDEKASMECYFKPEHDTKIEELVTRIKEIDGISHVETRTLSRFTGE